MNEPKTEAIESVVQYLRRVADFGNDGCDCESCQVLHLRERDYLREREERARAEEERQRKYNEQVESEDAL